MQDTTDSIGNRRIAMLIDSENAQPSLIEKMMAETGKYGQVTIRRIYGDWTTPEMRSWREILNTNAVRPIQQFRNTVGKNSTDSALIIDAMDILNEGNVNSFCLVSSDSDFTLLATRIREKGLFVMGIGRKSTPVAFTKACEVFVFTEILQPEKKIPNTDKPSKETKTSNIITDPGPLLINAFDMSVQENGWAFLGTMGEKLRQLDPSFDSRTYGYKQLSQLIRAKKDTFEIRENKSRSGPSAIYVKLKEERNP